MAMNGDITRDSKVKLNAYFFTNNTSEAVEPWRKFF